MVTTLYAGILGLIYIALSLFVVHGRFKEGVSIGAGAEDGLFKRIRLHGNFIEYVPLALILMIVAEQEGIPEDWLHMMGRALIAGRILHIWGYSRHKGRGLPFGLIAGMLLTFGVILTASVLCIRAYYVF